MSMWFGPIRPRGMAVLAATGVVGVVLAVHGWAHRGVSGGTGSLTGGSASAQTAPAATPPAGPTAGTGPAAGTGPNANAPGPLLASQPFAQYSFVIWPGTPSASAKAALTGLSVNVRRVPSGISITAAVNGQQTGSAHLYRNGARVYVVEATMGDDSGNSDYNLGDDGIVVTDGQGRIVQ